MPRVSPKILVLWLLVAVFAAGAVSVTFAGCTSPGDQYQASALSFAVAVDAAAALREADLLEPPAVRAIDVAVVKGQLVLTLWAEALKAGRDYPNGGLLVAFLVEEIYRLARE